MMDFSATNRLEQFKSLVGIKFQLYNSLFTSLPFHRMERSGVLLALLLNDCEDGYAQQHGPQQIVEDFFARHTHYRTVQEQLDLLFRFVQYVERQVVLFDALEDAAFAAVNDLEGPGSLKQLLTAVAQAGKQEALLHKLHNYAVRLVLTAHPTQFYPGAVLGIIHDLAKALAQNDAAAINDYLQQLGKTPFFKKQKPTPYDEATSLIWYLENVFYPAAGKLVGQFKGQMAGQDKGPLLQLGFWPGGDRDGNPFVTVDTTLKTADALRGAVLKCYYQDVRKLRRRLTFDGVAEPLQQLERQLYTAVFETGGGTALGATFILQTLTDIRQVLAGRHGGLFQHLVEELMDKVQLFGLHFASLDIRQESGVHAKVLAAIANSGPGTDWPLLPGFAAHDHEAAGPELVADTLATLRAIRQIQQSNGPQGCHRYIISQCKTAGHVLEVMQLLLLAGWQQTALSVDIVPLFETIDDLQQAETVMAQLYAHPAYLAHLQQRGMAQTIMLGFSDGTKDGGYLMANYSIYRAKERLTALSVAQGIRVVFFDGRGGPPARGGGKTHRYYASMGNNIANHELQLTIQGQTVSSNFGTVAAARFNMEQLLHAGISNDLFATQKITLEKPEQDLLAQLAELAQAAYNELKHHPQFMQYLMDVSPLRYYSQTNIASRPAKRGNDERLQLADLRAIPYVGAWAQLKQNVTGYFGVGTALERMHETGQWQATKDLYRQSLYFKTLMDNCEMAMKKCFFPLTQHLGQHPVHGPVWHIIHNEYQRTKKYLLLLGGKAELMQDYPVDQLSIQMRERIVLPLLTIQQYAIAKAHALADPAERALYEKLIMRCSFGIINAARNSA
jgi:phosphoenolpyruvate carboxylase